MNSVYNSLTPRLRRVFTSSFFGATFFGAFLTVAATTTATIAAANGEGPLACPAQQRRKKQAAAAAAEEEELQAHQQIQAYGGVQDGNDRISGRSARIGERVRLTSKGGWIEIPEPNRIF
ncbi:hypothetical protein OC861_005657 [Tilletia horrida]|nr:hypothetical protein OC861_005657 [Tilletia horrida]